MARTLLWYFLNDGSGKKYVLMAGVSSEKKPVNNQFATGSEFREVNTGKKYYFMEDAEPGNEWIEQKG